jgi:DNA-directed RNA polymerase subunit RPC12/RpoP
MTANREVYKLECGECGRTVTMPAVDGQHACSYCGELLLVAWNAERRQFSPEGEFDKKASGNKQS